MKVIVSIACVLVVGRLVGVATYDEFIKDPGVNRGQPEKCELPEMKAYYLQKNVSCNASPSFVKITSEPGYYFPVDVVQVNRCKGFCHASKSCMKVASRNRTFIVTRRTINDLASCYKVEVEEHTECKCMCNVKKEDCNVYQKYEDCACLCANFKNKQECDEKPNMMWNSETCRCVCNKPKEICSSGFIWNTKFCECVPHKQMMMD